MKEEDLKYSHFWEDLDRYITCNNLKTLFDESAKIMDRIEWVYDKARYLLGPEDGDELVLYVAACEEFSKAYAFAAYEMGRQCSGKDHIAFKD